MTTFQVLYSYSDSKSLVIHVRKSCELKRMQIVKLEAVCCCSLTIGTLSYEGSEGTYFIWIFGLNFESLRDLGPSAASVE